MSLHVSLSARRQRTRPLALLRDRERGRGWGSEPVSSPWPESCCSVVIVSFYSAESLSMEGSSGALTQCQRNAALNPWVLHFQKLGLELKCPLWCCCCLLSSYFLLLCENLDSALWPHCFFPISNLCFHLKMSFWMSSIGGKCSTC